MEAVSSGAANDGDEAAAQGQLTPLLPTVSASRGLSHAANGGLPRVNGIYDLCAYEQLPFGPFQWRVFVLCGLAIFAQAMPASLERIMLPIEEEAWRLERAQLSVLVSATSAAAALGCMLGGMAADAFGRRRLLLFSFAMACLFGLLSPAAPNFVLYTACRGLFAAGHSAFTVCTFVLIAETLPTSHRTHHMLWIGSWYGSGATVGIMLAYMAFPAMGWRSIYMAMSLPSFFFLFLRRSVPESPHFLLLRNARQQHRRSGAAVSKPFRRSGTKAAAFQVNVTSIASASLAVIPEEPDSVLSRSVTPSPNASPEPLPSPTGSGDSAHWDKDGFEDVRADGLSSVAVPLLVNLAAENGLFRSPGWLRYVHDHSCVRIVHRARESRSVLLCGGHPFYGFLLGVLCCVAAFFSLAGVFFLWLPMFLSQSWGHPSSPNSRFDLTVAFASVWLASMGAAIAPFLVAWFAHRVSRIVLLRSTVALFAVLVLMLPLCSSADGMYALLPVIGGVRWGVFLVLAMITCESFPTHVRGTTTGIVSACSFLGPISGYWLMSFYNSLPLLHVCIFIAAACSLALLVTCTVVPSHGMPLAHGYLRHLALRAAVDNL